MAYFAKRGLNLFRGGGVYKLFDRTAEVPFQSAGQKRAADVVCICLMRSDRFSQTRGKWMLFVSGKDETGQYAAQKIIPAWGQADTKTDETA